MLGSPFTLRNSLRVLAWVLPAIALAAATGPVQSEVLIDEEVTVSPSRVRPLEFDLASRGARVLCKFHLVEGRSGVRAVLLRRDDVHLWVAGRPNHALAATEFAESGGFMYFLDDPGEYAVVLDNRLEGSAPAVVYLEVMLLTGTGAGGPVQSPDPLRARVLVWVTLLAFALASLFTAWRLRLALVRRSLQPPIPNGSARYDPV